MSEDKTSEAAEPPVKWTRENRIRANRHLLDSLSALWDEYPDMRFGQLVMNISRDDHAASGFADTWEWRHGRWYERIDATWRLWAKAFDTRGSAASEKERLS